MSNFQTQQERANYYFEKPNEFVQRLVGASRSGNGSVEDFDSLVEEVGNRHVFKILGCGAGLTEESTIEGLSEVQNNWMKSGLRSRRESLESTSADMAGLNRLAKMKGISFEELIVRTIYYPRH